MAKLTPEEKRKFIDELVEADAIAKRRLTDAANDVATRDGALMAALHSRPYWWLPRYSTDYPSRSGWLAFAERRRRFAKGMRDLAALTALLALALPASEDRWMFVGFSVTIAMVWAWQFDVANREVAVLTGLEPRT